MGTSTPFTVMEFCGQNNVTVSHWKWLQGFKPTAEYSINGNKTSTPVRAWQGKRQERLVDVSKVPVSVWQSERLTSTCCVLHNISEINKEHFLQTKQISLSRTGVAQRGAQAAHQAVRKAILSMMSAGRTRAEAFAAYGEIFRQERFCPFLDTRAKRSVCMHYHHPSPAVVSQCS